MTPVSFRARLALAMSALILVIAAVVWFYVPRMVEREAIALMTHKAETLAQLTAFTIHPAVYFNDRAALEEALSGTRQDKDVAYVVVADAGGTLLAIFNGQRATAQGLKRRSAGGAVSADGSLYELMLPIREQQREIARLYIGMSLERLHSEVVQMRVGIGLLSAVILAAGLLAVLLISNVLTRPLRDVAAGAQRIAAGDLGHRVPEGRDDEIGRLAASFNDMAARVGERDASLRRLSKRLLSIQEEERVRIAREVHDELGQALTALKIELKHEAPTADLALRIDGIVDLVRRIAADLRPAILDDLGVTAALEQQLRRLRESTGIETTLTVQEEPELDMLTAVTLYRIAQEALANVVRHANASAVEIALSIRDGTAVLDIRDDGEGMTREQIEDSGSLGLVGMRERAELLGGSVTIESEPGEGTIVTAVLPLAKDDRNRANTLR
jgi:signal transduction histidine kinase